MNEKNKIIVMAVVTAIIVVWLIMSVGCANRPTGGVQLYGPHDLTTMTNHEWDIERRNLYADGWNDRSEALKKYGE